MLSPGGGGYTEGTVLLYDSSKIKVLILFLPNILQVSEKQNISVLDNGLEERDLPIRCSKVLHTLHIITRLPATSKYEMTFNFHNLIFR